MNVNVYKDFDDGSYDFFFRTVDSTSNLTSVQRYSVSEQVARGIYERLAQWFGEKNEPEPGEHAEQEEPRTRGVYVTADRSMFLKFDDDGDWSKGLCEKWDTDLKYGTWENVVSELPDSAFPLTLAESHYEYTEPDNKFAYFLGNGKIVAPVEDQWSIGGWSGCWDDVLMSVTPHDFHLRKAVPEGVES